MQILYVPEADIRKAVTLWEGGSAADLSGLLAFLHSPMDGCKINSAGTQKCIYSDDFPCPLQTVFYSHRFVQKRLRTPLRSAADPPSRSFSHPSRNFILPPNIFNKIPHPLQKTPTALAVKMFKKRHLMFPDER